MTMTDTATAPSSATFGDEHADDADPAVAAALGIVPATPGVRALAFSIDLALWGMLVAPAVAGAVLLTVNGPRADVVLSIVLLIVGSAASALFGLIQLIVHGRRGVTVGKAALRLRSVRATDYGRPGFGRVVLRALVLWLSGIVPVVGPAVLFASSLWDPQRRGRSILDRVGRLWLIDARAGLDPFDAKALRHARRALRPRTDGLNEHLPAMATGVEVGVEDALRIPDDRSRAGVVGPGGTGARWELALSAPPPELIDGVPGAEPTALPEPAPTIPTAAFHAPVATVDPAAAAASATAAALPAEPAPAPDVVAVAGAGPAGVPRRAQQIVRFDDGSLVRVPAFGLVGRDPEPAQGEAVDALIRLEDPERLMSKTHAAFGQDLDGVWVRDRASRNGTQLRSPEGEVADVPSEEAVRVLPGWTVQVGGRSFAVIARGADS
jgi:uncharacterized RDD family membrane protein YckC